MWFDFTCKQGANKKPLCRPSLIAFLAMLALPAHALLVPIEPPTSISPKVTLSHSEEGGIDLKSAGGSLQEVLQQVQAASKISFFVSEDLLGEPMDLEVKDSSWNSAVEEILQGYDFASSRQDGAIVKVFVLQRGEDAPTQSQFPSTIDERQMTTPELAPEMTEVEEQMASTGTEVPANGDEPPLELPDMNAAMLPPEIEPEELAEEPDPDQDQMQDYKEELKEKGIVAVGSPQVGPEIPEELRGNETQSTGDSTATAADGYPAPMPGNPGVELSQGAMPPPLGMGN